ncbi:amino acid adenylation domain-containing protein [Kitasatospora brasiliensis]|uniref:amino acid adenylation domain-containing protein n=1 Tax=Kitasatospora brasiliensis TaxID=3058040 RepID=UPI00292DD084|nr:amino acid adenylation domain-containing protein [Kitasatospora sp. K002]
MTAEPSHVDATASGGDDLRSAYEALSPERRALLALELARSQSLRDEGIRQVPRGDGPLPASSAQERLWYLDRQDPGSAAYLMPAGVRLLGKLDAAVLGDCLTEIVARHEPLRTTFTEQDGRPVQVVHSPAPLPLPLTDLCGLAGDEAARSVHELHLQEARLPFDLATDRPIRARLVRLAEDEHVLLLTLHHIASDGWSLGVLLKELSDLYGAFTQGAPSPLPPLEVQYADYVAWHHDRFDEQRLAAQLEHWRMCLEGAPVLELPGDRRRPPVRSAAAGSVPFRLDPATVERIEALAAAENATSYMVLLAAVAVLLHRWSGQDDLVLGAPVAGRTRPELEPLIGFFVNTLPLRMDTAGDPSFRGLLDRARAVCLDAYAHQDVPFERLVQELHPERKAGTVPLVQVMLALRNVPMTDLSLPGLALEVLDQETVAGKFDLCLDLVPGQDGGIHGRVEFSHDLFDADTVRRMADCLTYLIGSALDQPDLAVSRLRLFPEEQGPELAERLSGGGSAAAGLTAGTVHALFEARADLAGDAVAVLAGRERLTYRQLEERANRLAHYLRAQGIGPEQIVGVSLSRTADMVVTLLGLLKAGGAYVPLDPAYPHRRVAYMAEDAGVRCVLTDSAALARGVFDPERPEWQGLEFPRIICLDREEAALAAQPAHRPEPSVDERNLAYVIYTSGSTGRPKGSMNEHGGVANSVTGMNRVYGLTPEDRMLAISSLNYDMSVYEVFGALAAGAAVVVPADIETTDPEQLHALLRDQGVTAWSSAPALLDMLVNHATEHGGLEGVRLRVAGVGGDRMPPALPARLTALLPSVRLFNLAGMTEVSYCTTSHLVRADGPSQGAIPWGRPLPNHRIYVLDEHSDPVPLGMPGELLIGGAGPGRGYWRRPSLTAQRFVPDPFSPEPGARMYATGDHARFRPDGVLDFMGRLDQQVKIRGFRIELGEVEGALGAHPAVVEPVVTAREDAGGTRRLVAYLTVRDSAPSVAELRQFVAERLPDHMVPSNFVILDRLPLLPSGKLNRSALPAPDDALGASTEHQDPQGPLEEVLADIWAQVLDADRVGVLDDFFELGGHSLRATQTVSRIRDLFRIQLSIPDFLTEATVRALASHLRRIGAEQGVDPDAVAELIQKVSSLTGEELSEQLGEQER